MEEHFESVWVAGRGAWGGWRKGKCEDYGVSSAKGVMTVEFFSADDEGEGMAFVSPR
jgi:hypothetical protein